jgi:hypothetical protein
MANPSNPLDLGALFQAVTGALTQNKENLNKADTNNHDHGDNMVNTFQVITRAMQEKQDANAGEKMAYAAEVLRGQRSGSAQLYAKGLSQAAQQFQGQEVTADNALAMLSTLLGGGGTAAGQSAGLMSSPADGAYVTGNNIRFEWKASPGATKYWLIVRRVKDGSPRISKDLGNVLYSDEVGFGDDDTQYKWTVGTGDSPEKDATWRTFTNGAYVAPKQAAQAQQQADPGVGDIIGTLIRQAQGKPGQQPKPGEGVGDIIGTLIRQAQGKPGQQAQQQADPGVGDIIGTLIRQAQGKGKQQAKAKGALDTIVGTVVSNSAMGGSYRPAITQIRIRR